MSAESPKNSEQGDGSDRGQVSVTLPESMRHVIEDQLVGTIGTSKSDAIRTALAIYMAENGLLRLDEALPMDGSRA